MTDSIPYMTTNEIRQAFIEYFKNNGHQEVASSPLVPGNDPTLLFTNAGMVPFKDCFLGTEQRSYKRATSSQRCVRAGGKHNDLDNVGYTARHHTFFEMLGNFSFGDYFKAEAIRFAWDFLTKELKLPEEKLWVTVYHEDKQAEEIWFNDIGINQERFSRLGEKDNFWAMGDTGPCGPCSEIFFDHGEQVAGGPPGSPDEDGDRYIEIWNLVFMQYERDASGQLTELPNPSIDTGMGLERIAAVMQGVHSNYQIDLFANLIDGIAKTTGLENNNQDSLKVIADHIRSCAFLICDGVVPSNEGRGYVLRRIIRRAIRHGHKLGIKDTFFFRLVELLCLAMGQAYPELIKQQATIEQLLEREEQQFLATLDKGLKIFEQSTQSLEDNQIPGELVFKLYDTYGFPVDLTADIARERGMTLDQEGFDAAMEQQRANARAASRFESTATENIELDTVNEFTGYSEVSGSSIINYLTSDGVVEVLATGQEGKIILNQTPFYAESGGQVGDTGFIVDGDNRFEVLDTQKQGEHILHIGKVISGEFTLNQAVTCEIDSQRRAAIAANHSATHLMHAALQQVLGEHVSQKGSLVTDDRLRFDFSHMQPVTPEEVTQIELLVNQQIMLNNPVQTALMTPEQAQAEGAMALFGEKYGEQVRVLTMGEFSKELCGGTHVQRTGDIGSFKIINETGIASGVRRIEAVSGVAALNWYHSRESLVTELCQLFKSDATHLPEKATQAISKIKKLEKDIEKLNVQLASGGSSSDEQIETINDVQLMIKQLDNIDPKALRETVDQLKNKLGSGIVAIASVRDGKVSLIVGVTKDMTNRFQAGKLISQMAVKVGGKGGGRPDMAQAGGSDPAGLDSAFELLRELVAQ